MTANRGLFIRNNGNVGTTPIEGRLVLASMVAENALGAPRNGLLDQKVASLVTGSASSMSYNVGPCTPVVNRAANEGVYMFTLTGTSNVATDAAPGTGSRYDLIYVKQSDLDKGDAVNTASLAVWKGTAAASPTKPYADLPAGAYVLAEALVQAGAANAADAKVTITQVWRYTALRGAPIPVRNASERDEITAPDAQVKRLDTNGTLEEWTGSLWRLAEPSPRGVLKRNYNNGANNVSDGTWLMMDHVVADLEAGRWYEATYTFTSSVSATNIPIAIALRQSSTGDLSSNGTDVENSQTYWTAPLAASGKTDTARYAWQAPTSGTYNLKACAARAVGTGAIAVSTRRLVLRDMGRNQT
ncbi:hypothetical protein [Arthrobacter sp. B2a2-09]|uniref:hypothetical protein n=1 Tax=Arthrobacter sp. B2a2-09 TaxID=2952822 RepID=UPI0022CD5CDF|nr:hypothetical protein [Arthrobacter sp. B2a2-09]MCZ9884634.1 hypothetical protein [Arthrobacter sp. B2a2-09]